MDSFSIKELETLSGIKSHTLRIWEQRYDFLKPHRTSTGIRYYSGDQLKKVLQVSLLNRMGYKISLLNEMDEHQINETILAQPGEEAQEERIIVELIRLMIDLDIDGMDKLLTGFILARGIERTVMKVMFPFMERVGLLWMASSIGPAQEHLVSNLMRQKLILAIENEKGNPDPVKRVMMFLPEGEQHELGLLFATYLFKSGKWGVIYLGADVPLSEVKELAARLKPDYLYSHLTSGLSGFERSHLTAIGCRTPVLISGRLIGDLDKNARKSRYNIGSVEELLSFIKDQA